jgi:hypothetical protein
MKKVKRNKKRNSGIKNLLYTKKNIIINENGEKVYLSTTGEKFAKEIVDERSTYFLRNFIVRHRTLKDVNGNPVYGYVYHYNQQEGSLRITVVVLSDFENKKYIEYELNETGRTSRKLNAEKISKYKRSSWNEESVEVISIIPIEHKIIKVNEITSFPRLNIKNRKKIKLGKKHYANPLNEKKIIKLTSS